MNLVVYESSQLIFLSAVMMHTFTSDHLYLTVSSFVYSRCLNICFLSRYFVSLLFISQMKPILYSGSVNSPSVVLVFFKAPLLYECAYFFLPVFPTSGARDVVSRVVSDSRSAKVVGPSP